MVFVFVDERILPLAILSTHHLCGWGLKISKSGQAPAPSGMGTSEVCSLGWGYVMRSWYLLTHNSNYRQSLTSEIKKMDVEVYSPVRVTLRKRKDRPSSVKSDLPLFPGYLLLNFDPEVIHTTKITAFNGAHGFVRFGGDACVVQDSVVEALRETLLLRTDRWFDCIEYRNLPCELAQSLHLIIEMRSDASRKAAFYALLEKNALWQRLASRPAARVYSQLQLC
ncbi:Transcription antitermination protein RfaH [compost metagenome]